MIIVRTIITTIKTKNTNDSTPEYLFVEFPPLAFVPQYFIGGNWLV
ncbi:MAG: hypothetical protein PHN88_13200 [Ignavibacteria bacterium]|nr:hypothetical protein [Ignavibacteria bacterium]